MLRTILQTFLGIVFSLSGIVTIYFFIIGLNSGVNFLFLSLSLMFSCCGVFLFIKAGKSESMVNGGFQAAVINEEIQKSDNNFTNRLAANNAILNDWKKTNDAKESLRMLEISAKAEE